MKSFRRSLASLIVALSVTAQSATADSMSYLDNGVIRLGVDLAKGGTITYLATSGAGVNVINSFDLGREVQQSYWSGPDNYGNPAPPWAGTPWNANAAGDAYGNPSTVLDQTNDGSTIYTKTIPLQWALNNVACECVVEQWITLNSNTVQVHNRLTNSRSDHTQYPAYGQAMPAVYANGAYWRLLTYEGAAPYTNAPLTELHGVPPTGGYWWRFAATEHWAALVDDSGFGVGVFNPTITPIEGGFVGTPDVGGPSDDPTGQIAPTPIEIIDWNIVLEYDYTLVLGTFDEIRAYAVAHRPDDRPDYQFMNDRQHFSLVNATDAGWPVSGAWRVYVDQNDPYLVGPEQWWQALDVPQLYITAAYHTSGTQAQVFWDVSGVGGEETSVRFDAIPDGQQHTYAINLAASSTYQGTITRIRFDPSDGNDPGGYVDITAITWKSPDQAMPADLAITMAHSPDPAPVRRSLTYVLTVANNGPGKATGVIVTDSPVAGLTSVSATPSQGNCSGTSVVVCHLGTLMNGDAATVTVVVEPTQVGSISNTASVTGNETDPNTSNNSVTQITSVIPGPPADLTGNWQNASQTCKNKYGVTTCTIKGSLNVVNQGTGTSGACVARLYLSDDASYDASDTLIGEVNIPSLPAGGHKRLTVRFSLPVGSKASGKFLIAVLDANGAVPEANESNNNIASARFP
jgi:uncharacterized repeat protein (TIGR01451 family)